MITLYGTPDNPMGDWIRRAIAAIEKYSAEIAENEAKAKGKRKRVPKKAG